MALAQIQFYLASKLNCTLCDKVILTLDDGTDTQELEGTILYETPNQPQVGYYTYTVQYDDDDLVVSAINACIIKSVKCQDCCDIIRLGAKWTVSIAEGDNVLNNNPPGSDTLFDANVQGFIGPTYTEAAKDLYISAFCFCDSVNSANQFLTLRIADDAIGTGGKYVAVDSTSSDHNNGHEKHLSIQGIIPKGKFYAICASLDTPDQVAAWHKSTFGLYIAESF